MKFGEPNIDRVGEREGHRATEELLTDLKERMGSQYYREILTKLANNEPLDEEEVALMQSLKDDFKGFH